MERIDQWIEREPDPYTTGDYPLPCCGNLANEHDYPLTGGVICPPQLTPTTSPFYEMGVRIGQITLRSIPVEIQAANHDALLATLVTERDNPLTRSCDLTVMHGMLQAYKNTLAEQ
jgi:hypothetical protein